MHISENIWFQNVRVYVSVCVSYLGAPPFVCVCDFVLLFLCFKMFINVCLGVFVSKYNCVCVCVCVCVFFSQVHHDMCLRRYGSVI